MVRGLLGGSLLLSLMAFVPMGKLGLDWSAYYLPHLRFGELLIGALVALFSGRVRDVLPSLLLVRQSLRLLAWGLLLAALFLPRLYVSPWFPGVLGLAFCLLVGFIIQDLEAASWAKRILSSRVMVSLGRLSYSLYLWHWLILAFVRYIWGASPLTLPIVLAVCALTLLMSCLTYYGIESPTRTAKLSFGRAFVGFYLAPLLVMIAYCLYPKGERH